MKDNESIKHPVTVEDHKEVARRHTAKKHTAVNDALNFPTGDAFEADLEEIFASGTEESGETAAIALIDCDLFDRINRDFGPDEGDRILIETGKYIAQSLPEEARVYRIGGDEFGIIFRGTMEREEIFLLLNDLKNGYEVYAPDGEKQTITFSGATSRIRHTRSRSPSVSSFVKPMLSTVTRQHRSSASNTAAWASKGFRTPFERLSFR